jgi:hypothetical protein
VAREKAAVTDHEECRPALRGTTAKFFSAEKLFVAILFRTVFIR